MNKMKSVFIMVLGIMVALIFSSCSFSDSFVASRNISTAADQFEVFRRVVFYNGITDEYILVIEGYCSIVVDRLDKQLELTVKTGPEQYTKHFLGLSDNVTYFAEQIESKNVSTGNYRVIFKPSTIIPAIEVK